MFRIEDNTSELQGSHKR